MFSYVCLLLLNLQQKKSFFGTAIKRVIVKMTVDRYCLFRVTFTARKVPFIIYKSYLKSVIVGIVIVVTNIPVVTHRKSQSRTASVETWNWVKVILVPAKKLTHTGWRSEIHNYLSSLMSQKRLELWNWYFIHLYWHVLR